MRHIHTAEDGNESVISLAAQQEYIVATSQSIALRLSEGVGLDLRPQVGDSVMLLRGEHCRYNITTNDNIVVYEWHDLGPTDDLNAQQALIHTTLNASPGVVNCANDTTLCHLRLWATPSYLCQHLPTALCVFGWAVQCSAA